MCDSQSRPGAWSGKNSSCHRQPRPFKRWLGRKMRLGYPKAIWIVLKLLKDASANAGLFDRFRLVFAVS
jgi:hypothetical protein